MGRFLLVLSLARRRAAAALAAAASALVAGRAAAQLSPADDAFLQGKALMQQGRTAEACEKFAESQVLAPRGGTELNLAVCREKQGRYATALRLFHEARERAAKDGRSERIALAEARIQALQGMVSWLTVRLAPGADAPDLDVQCDGEALPRESWGKLRAVDPGPHRVTAVAAGRPRFEETVQIREARDAQVVEIPAAPEPPAARRLLVESVPSPLPPRAPEPSSVLPWTTPVGWVAVGLGAAALATGTGFGIRAIVDVHESAPLCPNGLCTTMAAYAQSQDAHPAARVADVALPLGLLATGAGLYLLLRSRPSAAVALDVGVSAGRAPRLTVGGAF
jgi:tetratricopeptide (TPR) repeat protein